MHKLVGDGLFIKKGGCVCEVETDGKRVPLEPADGKSFKKRIILEEGRQNL